MLVLLTNALCCKKNHFKILYLLPAARQINGLICKRSCLANAQLLCASKMQYVWKKSKTTSTSTCNENKP